MPATLVTNAFGGIAALLHMLSRLAAPSRQTLAACILLSLLIGSLVYEAIAVRPDRQWLALLCGLACGILIFLLLFLLLS
jgi:hypothetical protein